MSNKTSTRVFPILTAPEGLDIWNDKDPNMEPIRKQQEEFVKAIALDEMHGAFLPFGWKLELAAFTVTKDDTEE